ncbi:hypothetical protein BLS_005203 [Venturia inaequalis]|uniref:Major facilitator superfamily (MFS) profile domain-containing protein n=1 Tax=Venturia inaequalis TaxID=5025 RepID=A0A8H3UBP4_VENIN|nr:hypothetical protein EG328_008151 [Venturia inaequalis]KAE9969836.1 hypothetical protein BLS_005203 [Venturia inaequalis]RDI83666.1 hypothetical protein Vi05172_g6228 [Venturia inaequalis]
MAKLKDSPLVLALEDIDSDISSINRRRYDDGEEASLVQHGHGNNEGEFDCFLDPVSLERLPWHKRPSVYWLLVPFALSALAFGGVIVPKVNLVFSLICHEFLKEGSNADPHYIFSATPDKRCRVPEIQSRVSVFKLGMSVISGSMAAIIAPKVGEMSDRYGRLPMIVWINMGMIINEIVTIFAAQFPDTVSVNWILVGSVFDGLGGSFIAAMAVSHSYASDVTPASKRNVVFGYFHGCLFTGIALGPIIAGYIIKVTGDVIMMFYLAAGCHFIFILMLIFVIPESVPKARQIKARQQYRDAAESRPIASRLSKLRSFNLLEPLKILYAPGAPPAVRRNLILLASTDTIVFGVGMGAAIVILLYSNYAFGWDQWEQSKFVSVLNSSKVSCLLIFLPAITNSYRNRQQRRQGLSNTPREPSGPEGTDEFELTVIRFAILADTLGFLGYALSRNGTQFLLSGAVAGIGGIASPSMQAALTKHVPKEQVGQLLGAMGLLHAAGRVLGPMLFTGIYAATVAVVPQAYFLILTAMFSVAFFVSWKIRPNDQFVSQIFEAKLAALIKFQLPYPL